MQSISDISQKFKKEKSACCCGWGSDCQDIHEAFLALPHGSQFDLYKMWPMFIKRGKTKEAVKMADASNKINYLFLVPLIVTVQFLSQKQHLCKIQEMMVVNIMVAPAVLAAIMVLCHDSLDSIVAKTPLQSFGDDGADMMAAAVVTMVLLHENSVFDEMHCKSAGDGVV